MKAAHILIVALAASILGGLLVCFGKASQTLVQPMAAKTLPSASSLATNAQDDTPIDETKFIRLNGKVMSYDKALPILERQLRKRDLEKRERAAEYLTAFGNKLKGRPIIDHMIRLYKATPEKNSDPEKQLIQIWLKAMLLAAVAGSGDPRRETLLKLGETDPDPEVRKWTAEARREIAQWGEWPPGGVPGMPDDAPKPPPPGSYTPRYIFLRHALTQEEITNQAKEIFSGQDLSKITRALLDLIKSPVISNNPALFDSATSLFKRADQLKAKPNEIQDIKELILDVVAGSKDNRLEAFLEAAQKDSDSEVQAYAKDKLQYLKEQQANSPKTSEP